MELQILGIVCLFLIPYLVVSWFMAQNEIIKNRSFTQKYRREIAFDATAYAFENKAKNVNMTSQKVLDMAVGYMQSVMVISTIDAEKIIESCLGKMSNPNAGASGLERISQ